MEYKSIQEPGVVNTLEFISLPTIYDVGSGVIKILFWILVILVQETTFQFTNGCKLQY